MWHVACGMLMSLLCPVLPCGSGASRIAAFWRDGDVAKNWV